MRAKFMMRIAVSLMLAAPVLFATPAGARGFNPGLCALRLQPHEKIGRWIDYCRDIAQRANLKALPETAAGIWFVLGELYHFDHQYEMAADSYTKSLGWEHKSAEVLTARGDAYTALGKADLARADYETAAVLKNPSPEDLSQRCWMRALRGGPLDRAAEDCDAAVKAMPDGAAAKLSRCLLRYRKGAFAAAARDCDAVLSREPQSADALYFRGLAKRKTGDASGGDADIAAALRLNSRLADAYEIFGIARE
jgi:tetratricopeptide (TPR) repeat protein